MPFYPDQPTQPTFEHLLRSFAADDLFEPGELLAAAQSHGASFGQGRGDTWDPVLTLWAWLWQVASASKSCACAVARALAWRLALGLEACSANTGAYCKARQKLPLPLLVELTLDLGSRLEERAEQAWLWRGRHVKVVDGTTLTAPDTPDNQAAFPQRDHLPVGGGLPLLRLVAFFGLATGACCAAALGPYAGAGSGETTLAWPMLESIGAAEVLLGDRLCGTYWMLAGVARRGAGGVFRLHSRRKRKGGTKASRLERRLGECDTVQVWSKPKQPEWMDEETYAAVPDELRVRVLWRRIDVPGFRTQEVTLVTTMTDPAEAPAQELFGLYRRRWQAELDLRSLKGTLKMEHLSCLTADMLRKEVWAHLLGYDLTRAAQAQAARQGGLLPWRLSFTGTRDQVCELREQLAWSAAAHRAVVLRCLWVAAGQRPVPDRPDRVEPRRVKRGPKNYPRLTEPRQQARARLMGQTAGPQ